MYQEELQTTATDISVKHLRVLSDRNELHTIAAHATEDTVLARGTPMALNSSTGLYDVWATGGANGLGTIVAFVWPEPITQLAADTRKGTLMMKGQIDARDIPVVGGTAEQLKAALKGSGLRANNIDVMEIDSVV